jgi:hypothetical protein
MNSSTLHRNGPDIQMENHWTARNVAGALPMASTTLLKPLTQICPSKTTSQPPPPSLSPSCCALLALLPVPTLLPQTVQRSGANCAQKYSVCRKPKLSPAKAPLRSTPSNFTPNTRSSCPRVPPQQSTSITSPLTYQTRTHS